MDLIPSLAETKFSGHARPVYSHNGRHGHARRNGCQGYNPRSRAIGFCTKLRVRIACAKNKGERGCVGGGGRVEHIRLKAGTLPPANSDL